MSNFWLGFGALLFLLGASVLDSNMRVGAVMCLGGVIIVCIFSTKYHYFDDPDLKDFDRRNKKK